MYAGTRQTGNWPFWELGSKRSDGVSEGEYVCRVG